MFLVRSEPFTSLKDLGPNIESLCTFGNSPFEFQRFPITVKLRMMNDMRDLSSSPNDLKDIRRQLLMT